MDPDKDRHTDTAFIINRYIGRTGIKSRLRALEQANLSADDIDFILCSNVYNDYMTPALSCIIQGSIGAKCPCLDINGACAGFVYALHIANGYLATGFRNVLVVCAESPSKMVDWNDRSTCVLFGDAAAAVVVTRSEDEVHFKLGSASRPEVLYAYNAPGNCTFTKSEREKRPLYMSGQEVYKFATSAASTDLLSLLEQTGMKPEDIKYFLLHQANLRIIDTVRLRLKQDHEKFPCNIQNYGNTSSASVPLLLDELNRQHKLQDGDWLMFSAFGAGLVTGSCLLRWHS